MSQCVLMLALLAGGPEDLNRIFQRAVTRDAMARAAERRWELANPTVEQKAARQRNYDIFDANAREWKSRKGDSLGRAVFMERQGAMVLLAWYAEKEDVWKTRKLALGVFCDADKKFIQVEAARQAKRSKTRSLPTKPILGPPK